MSPLPNAGAVAELVRLPATLSVPGDVLTGAALAGWPFGGRTARLVGTSVCLYWAGMALNDYADRDIDARERPARPLPSGRVSPRFALCLAAGLTGAGLVVAATAGRGALAVAAPLAGAVWAYDLALKDGPAGPVGMSTCRALDVLLGAGGARAALPAAGTVAAHTVAVTLLSRSETTAHTAGPARAALVATGLVTTVAGLVAGRQARLRATSGASRALAAGLLGAYAAELGRVQLAAARDPSPRTVQHAVGAGVLGLAPLEGSLLAAAGTPAAAFGVAAGWPLARRLARRVSPT